jgi:hypothetical protein
LRAIHVLSVQDREFDMGEAHNAGVVAAGDLVPSMTVAKEFGVTRRTLGRWFVNPEMGFPAPIEINRRLYFSRSALEAWKIARLAAISKAA